MWGCVLLWFCTSPTLSSCAINEGLADTRWPQLNHVTGVKLFCLSRLISVAVLEVGPSSKVIPTYPLQAAMDGVECSARAPTNAAVANPLRRGRALDRPCMISPFVPC